MQDFDAKWITNKEFCAFEPINVFHKENDDVKIPGNEAYQNKHILFRRTFSLPEFGKAILRISADDYYKLYINGRFVTQGPAPGYPFHYYYNEIDVTRYLHPHTNVIAVHTYYQGLVNRVWVSADLRQGLACELFLDGKQVLTSDETWKCAYHTGFSACGKFGYDTQFAECYDARAAECGFSQPEFDDSVWENAHFRAHADYIMFRQPTEQLAFCDVKPKELRKTPNGLFIDFGFEAVGYLTFRASGKKGDTLTLRFGEELNDDGSVRYKTRCNCDYEEKFILSGKNADELKGVPLCGA